GAANKYVADVEPWILAKLRQSEEAGGHATVRLSTVLYNLVEVLRLVTQYCAPFLPATSSGIAQCLGISLSTGGYPQAIPLEAEVLSWGRYPAGMQVQPGSILFPKLTMPKPDQMG